MLKETFESDEKCLVLRGVVLSKEIMKLFITVLISVNTFALPGMSSVRYEFSLNRDLFSKSAIDCQQRVPSSIGMRSLTDFLNKTNCNAHTDSIKFCKCLDSVTSKNLDRPINKEIADKVIKKIAVNAVANRVQDIPLYKDLISVTGSSDKMPQCFTEKSDDPIFGYLVAFRGNTGSPRPRDLLATQMRANILNDLEKSEKIPREETVYKASDVKTLALESRGNTESSNSGIQNLYVQNLADRFWDNIEKSPIISLMKKDEKLPIQIAAIRATFSGIGSLDFANKSRAINKEYLLEHKENFFEKKFSNSENFYSFDRDDELLTDSAIFSACNEVQRQIRNIIEGSDIEKDVRALTAAYQEPTTDVEKKAYNLIQEEILVELEKDNSYDSKQEVEFDRDSLFCEFRKVVIKENSLTQVGVDPNRDKDEEELAEVTREMVELKKIKNQKYKTYVQTKKVYDDLTREQVVKAREKTLLESLLNGEYSRHIDNQIKIDVENSDLYNKAEAFSPELFSSIRRSLDRGKELILTRSELEAMIESKNIAMSELSESKKKYTAEYQSSLDLYRRSKNDVAEVTARHKKLSEEYAGKYGKRNAIATVAKAEQEESIRLGVESSLKSVINNQLNRGRHAILDEVDPEKLINGIAIKDLKNQTKASSAISVPRVIENDNVQEKAIIKNEIVKKQLTTKKSKDIFSNPSPSTRRLESSREVIVNENFNSQVHKDSKLEDRIKQLEEMIEKKKEHDENNISESTPTNNNIKKIDQLSSIISEREKLENDLKNMKSQVVVENITTSVSDQSSSSSSKALGFSNNSRVPNSVSENDFSSDKNTEKFNPSSSSTDSLGSSANVPATSSSTVSRTNTSPDTGDAPEANRVSLTANSGSLSKDISDIEFVKVGDTSADVETRLVKVDFLLSDENLVEKEQFIKDLFVEGEVEIIIETLEGKKIIVKHRNENILEKEKIPNKVRHQNLINLLKVSNQD